jgi:hypothetical protein
VVVLPALPEIQASLHTGCVNIGGEPINLATGNYARVVNVIGYASNGEVVPRPPSGPVGIRVGIRCSTGRLP